MPKAGPPPWKKRKEPILDHYVQACIDQAGGKADPDTGQYATLVYAGIDDYDRALEIKRALYRARNYLKVSVKADISEKDANGSYSVVFTAYDRRNAQKYVLEKYGPDRSKWPFDPRAKAKKEA